MNRMPSFQVDNIAEGVDFSEKITRAKFEELNMDLFKGMFVMVCKVMQDILSQDTKRFRDAGASEGGSE